MQVATKLHKWTARLLAATVATALAVAVASSGHVAADEPDRSHDAVTRWAQRNAHPLASVDPTAPLDDLEPLQSLLHGATIVGLGESSHGAAEEIGLKHRVLRVLVEQLGFRSIAWEDDWTTGLEINDYILGGPGDPAELVARMTPPYRLAPVVDVLRWLRDFNDGRSDPVQFVGVEYYLTRQPAYDLIEAYVEDAAPERLAELDAHLDRIEPTDPDPFEHIRDYGSQPDKQPYIDDAYAVRDIVRSITDASDPHRHQLALHAAGQIVSFYEHFAMDPGAADIYRDARAAESLQWWQHLTGDRIAYWAATPHTANAPDLRIVRPPDPDMRFPSAGSYLRRWYGDSYRSIGFTLDRGTVTTGPGQTADLPPARSEWFEHPLGDVRYEQFLLDLHQRAPGPVGDWLHDPTRTRGLADAGAESYIEGGSVAQWFDVLVHRQTVTPA